jgi:hypothetical protein
MHCGQKIIGEGDGDRIATFVVDELLGQRAAEALRIAVDDLHHRIGELSQLQLTDWREVARSDDRPRQVLQSRKNRFQDCLPALRGRRSSCGLTQIVYCILFRSQPLALTQLTETQ